MRSTERYLTSKFTSCRSIAVSVARLLSACIASLNAASSSRAAIAKAAKPRGLPAVAPGYRRNEDERWRGSKMATMVVVMHKEKNQKKKMVVVTRRKEEGTQPRNIRLESKYPCKFPE